MKIIKVKEMKEQEDKKPLDLPTTETNLADNETINMLKQELKAKNEQIDKLLNRDNQNQKWERYEQQDLTRTEITVETVEEQELTIADRLEILEMAKRKGILNLFFESTEQDFNSDLSSLYFLNSVKDKYFPKINLKEDFLKLKAEAIELMNRNLL